MYALINIESYNKQKKQVLDVLKFVFRLGILSFLEFDKIILGQTISRSLLNIFFYFFYLLFFSITTKEASKLKEKRCFKFNYKSDFLFFLILIICFIETISWNFMNSPFNSQALNAIDFNYIFKNQKSFIPFIILGIFSCISLIFFPCFEKEITLPKITFIINIINFHLMFIFMFSILCDFHEKSNNSLFDLNSDSYYSILKRMIDSKFNVQPQVLNTSNKLKNLILVQLESFPSEIVNDAKISPNLNNFSNIFEYISPIIPQPYTTWSFSGLLVTQTGMPQIYPDPKWGELASQTDYLYVIDIKGVSDILNTLNYKLDYMVTGKNPVMGFDKWIKHHNIQRIYKAKNDLYLFNYLADEYLPKIDKIIRDSNFEKHYLSLVVNSNTHIPYVRPMWCNLNFPDIPEYHKPFYCIDHALKRFLNKFLELKMYEHTLLVIYPDHPPYQMNYKELFILFPGMNKVENKINGEITFYDFAPTILDLIGIKKYQPPFPYGRNIYRNDPNEKYCLGDICAQKRSKPDLDDLSLIYKLVHFEHGKNIHTYNLSNPFSCRINGTDKIYYSYTPCFTNIRAKEIVVPRTTLY